MVGKQGFGCTATERKGGRGAGDGDSQGELSLRKVKVGVSSKGRWEPSISRVLGREGQDHNCLKGRELEKEHRTLHKGSRD